MDTRQLILIRQFFAEARLTPAAETPFLRIKRTLNLDLCVELALNLVVRDFGTAGEQDQMGGRRDLSREKLWELAATVIQRKCGKTIPERSTLKTLHELRNLAQHRGTAPSADEVRGLVEPVRTLLEFTCRDLYGLDFERLREWDALEHQPLRSWIDESFDVLDRGAPYLAAASCKLAFDCIVTCVRTAAAGPNAAAHFRRSIRVMEPETAHAINSLSLVLQEAMVALEAELIAVSLGLPVADHFRFQRTSRSIHATLLIGHNWSLTPSSSWPSDDEQGRAAAAFMVDYLGRACVLLESAFPGVFTELKLPKRLRETEHWTHAFGHGSDEPPTPGVGQRAGENSSG
jgi:hypothetical protein